MKHLFISMAALFALAGCGKTTAGYKITGDIAGAGNGKAVLNIYEDRRGEANTSDTVSMTEGKFTFSGNTPQVCSVSIAVVPDGQEAAYGHFFLENAPISVSGNWNDVIDQYGYRSIKLNVEGSRNTDFYNRISGLYEGIMDRPEYSELKRMSERAMILREENVEEYYKLQEQMEPHNEKFRADLRREQKQLILDNPDMATAAYYLDMLNNDMSLEELESTFNSLNEDVRNSVLAKEVRDEIEIRKAVQPGSIAPDFTLKQPDGTPLTLSDLRGKIVIIDFWASWCKPCRASNPAMKQFYEKYHDQGVEILGITNDTQHGKWVEAIEEDGLPWLNVIDEFPVPRRTARVITMYAAPYLPTLILIDRDGTIVAHNIAKDELEKEVVNLLSK